MTAPIRSMPELLAPPLSQRCCLVAAARRRGFSFPLIGAALGISHQSVAGFVKRFERYHGRIEPRSANKTKKLHRNLAGRLETGAILMRRDRVFHFSNDEMAPNQSGSQHICWNKSGFKGVTKDRRTWVARVGTGKNQRMSRGHLTAIDAAQAYDEMARDMYGSAAYVNFPLNGELAVLKKKNRHCAYGHQMTGENTKINSDGYPTCLKCLRLMKVRINRRSIERKHRAREQEA